MPDGTPMCFTASQLHSGAAARRRIEAADEACRRAMAAAEVLVGTLDRYPGDAGDDADWLLGIEAELEQIGACIERRLGKPAEPIRDASGGIVALRRATS